MNLDIIDTILTTGLAGLMPTVLLAYSPLSTATRRRLAFGIGVWFVVVVALASMHTFTSNGIGTPAIGVAFAAPVIAAFIAVRKSSTIRTLASGVPLTVFVLLNIGRLLGAQFLILHAQSRLPASFAHSAGWGDVLVGALALPLAWAMHRRVVGWRGSTLAWNILGTMDLLAAVTLGAGSAAGSPLRFIHEIPDSGLMGELPWLLIPGFLVPFYLIIHLFIYRQLSAARKVPDGAPSLPGVTVY
jgi:hypothetical protein